MPGVERTPQIRLNPISESRSAEEIADLLASEPVEVLGLLPYSSNFVFLARVGSEPEGFLAIYKPTRGERPLWDFPSETLAAREVAARVVSEAGGWDFVPPTVLRSDAPLGPGSLQLFIDHDPERHYFVMKDDRLADFEAFAAFDIVVNNADRKAGHVLEDRSGRLWAVDHGLTFNTEPKLRTVIWDFAGNRASDEVLARVARVRGALQDDMSFGERLRELLSEAEFHALEVRTHRFLEQGVYPEPTSSHHLPWPLV